MAHLVVNGATCMCSFGSAPGTLTVTSQLMTKCGGNPAATVQDTNISPFAMCSSMANPAVASATAAALGVLTPQPCQVTPAGTWIPTKPSKKVDGKQLLASDAKLMCGLGMGQISILSPGQTKLTVS